MRFAFLWNEVGDMWKDVFVSDADASLKKVTSRDLSPPVNLEDDDREEDDISYAERMAAGFTELAWLPDGSAIVAIARGRVHLLPLEGTSEILWSGQPASSLRISRRCSSIFFICEGNVMVIRDGAILRLTSFMKPDRKVRDFSPSPDGNFIALFVEDESEVLKARMPDYMPQKEVRINENRRHNVGTEPPKRHFGIAEARVSVKCQLQEFGDGETFWPYSIEWLPNSNGAVFAISSRDHKRFQLRHMDPHGQTTTIYEEISEPWFPFHGIAASSCSNFVRFLSFRSGWNQIWEMPIEGGEIRAVTKEGFDIDSFSSPLRTDELFFTAYANTPIDRSVFRIRPGRGPEEIAIRSGCFRVYPNEDGESLALVHSAACAPPQLLRVDGPKMRTILSCGESIRSELESVQIETLRVPVRNNRSVIARTIKPATFDPSKRYPIVFSCVYAGQAKNQFSRYHPLDVFMANELGYIVLGVDLSASIGYGRDFFFGYHHSLGIVDSDELVDVANFFCKLPYVDPERIGVWGGSYGGFLTLMAMSRYPGVFHTGIAWKSVTEWKNYYEWYTSQRLGLPDENQEVYKETSPLSHIDKLQGNLLLVAGMQDDNVLFQDTVWVIQKLIENGKYFDLMVYPRDDHGLTLRHESLPDLMERIAAYFEDKMGVGPTS
jgi:dipeptidyl-peptidase-4